MWSTNLEALAPRHNSPPPPNRNRWLWQGSWPRTHAHCTPYGGSCSCNLPSILSIYAYAFAGLSDPASWLQDRVANIRFNAAKTLERLAPLADTLLIDQAFKPCLTELQHDADIDVRFFARQALSACDNATAMA